MRVRISLLSEQSRDGSELDESSANLTLASLGPAHEGNYSCAAVNSLGLGEEGSFQLEVTGESLLANLTTTNCSPAKVLDKSS